MVRHLDLPCLAVAAMPMAMVFVVTKRQAVRGVMDPRAPRLLGRIAVGGATVVIRLFIQLHPTVPTLATARIAGILVPGQSA